MSRSPAVWTSDQLAHDATTAEQQFRAERLAVSNSWESHYAAARAKFDLLFSTLGNLAPGAITEDSLKEVYRLRLGEALRYLAGPPVSDDDLEVIAGVDSIAPGVLIKDAEALNKVFGVIERVIDQKRFPWMQTRTSPTDEQREAALALGATRWETTWQIVVPYAKLGILGSVFLGLARALGETMAVTMVIGNRPEIAKSLFAPGYTMASVLANEFSEAAGDLYLSALIEIGLALFLVTIIVNALARFMVWSVTRGQPARGRA